MRPDFGPLLGYDLVRTGRRGGLILHRCFYLLTLLLVLYLVYVAWFPEMRKPENLFAEAKIDFEKMPKFSESFFFSFLLFQELTILVVTPAYTAGAIATEKQRGTLDDLLTTHLTSREIVVGILASRLSNLLLLLLAGLPVLGLLQLVGGIDPNVALASFGVLAIMMVSLGAVGTLASVYSRTPLRAICATYVVAIYYLGTSYVALAMLTLAGSGSMAVWSGLIIFGLVHVAITVFTLLVAIRALRRAAAAARTLPSPVIVLRRQHPARSRQHRGGPEDAVPDHLEPVDFAIPVQPLPAIRGDALAWKETHAEQRYLRDVPVILFGVGIAVAFLTYGMALLAALTESPSLATKVVNHIARALGTFYAVVLLFCFALSASVRLTRERESQTLDSLLTTPYEPGEILRAKWLASLLRFKHAFPALGTVWLLGFPFGGVSILAIPFLLTAVCVYAGLAASVGLWFSLAARNTGRAILYTIITLVLLLIGPGPLWWLFSGGTLADNNSPWLMLFFDKGLSPIGNLLVLCFSWEGIAFPRLTAAMAGLACHAALALFLDWLTRRRFEALKGPATMASPT